MFEIEIHIPNPKYAAMFLASAVVTVLLLLSGSAPSEEALASAQGGDTMTTAERIVEAEKTMYQLRQEQAVLLKQEEILRAELHSLEEARNKLGQTENGTIDEQFNESKQLLLNLLEDKKEAERQLVSSLRDLWEAQGRVIKAGSAVRTGEIVLEWPVNPTLGISAKFNDAGYKKRFGFNHNAIDIPVKQGSVVRAAADGVVSSVSDKGMGFNSLIIEHDGYATLYGHVQGFLVAEGQRVRAGEPVAISGGLPGTPGAGTLTTGPHLHFELTSEGVHIDPMPYLPVYSQE